MKIENRKNIVINSMTMVCVCGQYKVKMNGEIITLNPGDELLIAAGVKQSGECIAGTRTIHAFGAKRAEREGE